MAEITAEQVEESAAGLRAMKKRKGTSAEDLQAASEEHASLRSAHRAQEEAAGRRQVGHTVETSDNDGSEG